MTDLRRTCLKQYYQSYSPVWKEIPVAHPGDEVLVRRIAQELAEMAGFSRHRVAKASLIVSELATNIIKHTSGGTIRINLAFLNRIPFISIASFDTGPGIQSIKNASKNGTSSTDTLGTGLGAIRRLSDKMNICSTDHSYPCPNLKNSWKTIIACQIWGDNQSIPIVANGQDFSSLLRPMEGAQICGDGIHVASNPFCTRFTIMDGTGRGGGAAEAICRAMNILNDLPVGLDPEKIIELMSYQLSETQGMSSGILEIDHKTQHIYFSFNGSIKARIYIDNIIYSADQRTKSATPHIKSIDISNARHVLAIVHTDGLTQLPEIDPKDIAKDIPAMIWCQTLFRNGNLKDDIALLTWTWKKQT